MSGSICISPDGCMFISAITVSSRSSSLSSILNLYSAVVPDINSMFALKVFPLLSEIPDLLISSPKSLSTSLRFVKTNSSNSSVTTTSVFSCSFVSFTLIPFFASFSASSDLSVNTVPRSCSFRVLCFFIVLSLILVFLLLLSGLHSSC